nr:hypothetical protein [Tanacetum cinerariifolium]
MIELHHTSESSKGKSPVRTSKSRKYVTVKESVEELVFEITLDNVEKTFDDKVGDAGQPPLTNVDVTQANAAPRILKKNWFKKAPRPETLNRDWNTVKTINDTPKQSWFNEMVQAGKPSLMFDELMSTPIHFSAFAMNRLKLNKIKREVLVGIVFNLSKGNKERTYSSSITNTPTARARTNRKSKHEVFSTMRILSVDSIKIEKKYGYGYLEEKVIRRADQKIYKFK